MCQLDDLTTRIGLLVIGVLLGGEWRVFPFAASKGVVALAKHIAPPTVRGMMEPPSPLNPILKSLVETSPTLRLIAAFMCLTEAGKFWLGWKLVTAYEAIFPARLRQRYPWFTQGCAFGLIVLTDGLLWVVFGPEAGLAGILPGFSIIAAAVDDYLLAKFQADSLWRLRTSPLMSA